MGIFHRNKEKDLSLGHEVLPTAENRKVPQVIDAEKLLTILKLWHEFSNWRKQSPPQIVTGILAEEVGLILNDTIIETAVVSPGPTRPSYPFTILTMVGKLGGFLRVRLYDAGITIDQLSRAPTLEELFRDPEDWVYHTIITAPVQEATKLLTFLYPQRKFVFVYGTEYFKEPCTNRKIYISSPNADPTNFDEFLIVKDRYANSNRDTIKVEFLWSNGDIYAMEYPINKPFKPNLIRIERSLL
jgi:hypothetical protein